VERTIPALRPCYFTAIVVSRERRASSLAVVQDGDPMIDAAKAKEVTRECGGDAEAWVAQRWFGRSWSLCGDRCHKARANLSALIGAFASERHMQQLPVAGANWTYAAPVNGNKWGKAAVADLNGPPKSRQLD
jgi:hypothetical protein